MIDPKDITINGKQLSDILASHKKWLMDEEGSQRADLQGADLKGADLQRADLQRADLQDADLQGAYLQGADLQRAYLQGADLQRAYLQGAYLQGANLQRAYLQRANLQRADLRDAYLQDAELQGAKNAVFAMAMVSICPEGDIIGWKKCKGEVIVKLLIPADAKRSNATGRKCRAEFAKVLEIFGDDVARSNYDGGKTIYKVGETIRPDKWDDNRWNECSNGIHFFITRAEAEAY